MLRFETLLLNVAPTTQATKEQDKNKQEQQYRAGALRALGKATCHGDTIREAMGPEMPEVLFPPAPVLRVRHGSKKLQLEMSILILMNFWEHEKNRTPIHSCLQSHCFVFYACFRRYYSETAGQNLNPSTPIIHTP